MPSVLYEESIIRWFSRLSFPRSRQEDVFGASVRCAEQDHLFKEIATFEHSSEPKMFKQSPGVFSWISLQTHLNCKDDP